MHARFRSTDLALLLFSFAALLLGCSQIAPLHVSWYYLDRPGMRPGLYLALFNQGSETIVINNLTINNASDAAMGGWSYSKGLLTVPQGKFLILPLKEFGNNRHQEFPPCFLPVKITVSDERHRSVRIEGLPAAPSSVPPAFQNCLS